MPTTLAWKPDWPEAQERLLRWWRGEGLAVCLNAQLESPIEPVAAVPEPASLEVRWLDPDYRVRAAEHQLANRRAMLEAFPYFDAHIGPGSLGLLLGARAVLASNTIWYLPSITDPEAAGPLHFDPEATPWWDAHLAVLDAGLRSARGRYLVGMPDIIENLDTLAALRGDMNLLYDLKERPGWVMDRLAEINQAFFTVYDLFYERVRDAEGGNAVTVFRLWGPGKTAKIQCDFSASISPQMFRRFAAPFFAEQCRFFDFSLYHLDGTNALQHVDPLLEIPRLNAIEWTPQAGRPTGGSPEWYPLYRRIKAGGKGVQVLVDSADEVIPLLDAIGPAGTFVLVNPVIPEREAEDLAKALEPYY